MEKKTIIPLRWFIGFLCVMGAMTFISRQIYTSKLPVVTAEKFTQQNIIHNVRAAGTAQYDSVKPVFLPGDVLIDKVCVHTGDKAEKGDILAMLNVQSLKRSADELEAQISELQNGSSAYDTDGDIPVFTESGMRVKALNVGIGDSVKTGDVLMTVDNDHLLKYIGSLEADRSKDMISRNGAVDTLNAAAATDGEDLMKSESREKIATLNITIDEQQKLINRYMKVYQNGGNILAESDGTVTQLNVKTGDITSENALMVISGSCTPASVLETKKTQLEELRAMIAADGAVTCPETGTVSRVAVEAGSASGEGAAFFITDTSGNKLYFTADIDESSAKKLSVGDKVGLSFRNGRLSFDGAHISALVKTDTGYRAEIPLDPEEFSRACELENSEIGEMCAAPKTSETYQCINKDAVYGSGRERYIYVLREYDGFFGKEYHAVKQDFTENDENDEVIGTLSTGLTEDDKIIVTTDRPLSDSIRVRLAADMNKDK